MHLGRKIKNRYVMEKLLSRSGSSSVYVVNDLQVPGKKYILKEIMDTEHNSTERKVAEFVFEKEIEILKRLKYDRVARVYDGFMESGRFYILKDYINGTSLGDLIKNRSVKQLSEETLSDYFRQVIYTVQYINSIDKNRKTFRDLRPDSFVLAPDGKVVMVNHGIAHLFCSQENLEDRFAGLLPPESLKELKFDEKSDIYAVGALFYTLVTGEEPAGEKGETISADKLNSNISKPLSKFLSDCLSLQGCIIKDLDALRKRTFQVYNRVLEDREQIEIKRRRKKIVISALFILVLLSLASYLLIVMGLLFMCEKNCKKIGNALQAYAADHGGRHPDSLSELVPRNIKKIPVCPVTGKDTYSKSYRAYNFYGFKYCRFYCSGHNHSNCRVPKNYPRYNTYDGVLSKPPAGPYAANPIENLLEAYRLDKGGKYKAALRKFANLTMIDQKTLRQKGGIEKYIVFWNMARIYEKTGKRKDALEKYKSAAKLLLKENVYSFNKNVVLMLIHDLKRLGNTRYALHFYNTLTHKYVIERSLPDTQVIADMVDIYCELGRNTEAIKLLRKYYPKAPNNEKIFVSAEIYRLKGFRKKSVSYYRSYLRRKGQKPMHERAVKMIEKTRGY
ncbi:MAG: protein kinase [Candidatus Eremiobacteraeota bacterium]|nr:protein kinase [Candidatus Eremiobacteraeota bacterium]